MLMRHGTFKEIPDLTAFFAAPLAKRMDMAVASYLKYGIGLPTVKYLQWLLWHCLHVSLFSLLLKRTTPARSLGLAVEHRWAWWDTAYAKFNAWFYLLECFGLGMSFGMDWRPKRWFFRFVPGTYKSPGLPLSSLGHKRTVLDVSLHAVGALAALRLLLRPRSGAREMRPVVLSELLATLLDWSPMHHLFYNFLPMLALCFPADSGGLVGSQLAIVGLYFFSGLAKRPLWAKHLNASFFAHSRWLVGQDWARRLFYRGEEASLTPLADKVLAPVPLLVEAGGAVALALGDAAGLPSVARLGHLALLSMHAGIVTSMPLDVGAFNIFYAASATYLLRWRCQGLDIAGLRRMHPILLAALTSKLLYVLYGFQRPDRVHYLQGWRVWSGNWTLPYLLVRRAAAERIGALVKSPAPSPIQGSALDPGAIFGMAYMWVSNLGSKGLAASLESAMKGLNPEEYSLVHLAPLQAWMMGETWGDVRIMNAMCPALVRDWYLQEGDVRMLVINALPWSGGSARWEVRDLKTGLVCSGVSRVEDLERACGRPSDALAVEGLAPRD